MISFPFLPSSTHFHPLPFALAAALALGLSGGGAQAASITVPNGSFESPVVDPQQQVALQFAPWFDAPAPNGVPAQQWDQATGIFINPAAGDSAHIPNIDGNQAMYLFANPGVGVFQDLSALFQIGQSYQLTLGLRGGQSPGPNSFPLLLDGTTMELGLFYRDTGNNIVRIGGTTVTYQSSTSIYPQLTDYHFTLGPVLAGDAWAGKTIGIEILSTVASAQNGYWDLDNVRLQSVPEPASVALLVLGLAGLASRRSRVAL